MNVLFCLSLAVVAAQASVGTPVTIHTKPVSVAVTSAEPVSVNGFTASLAGLLGLPPMVDILDWSGLSRTDAFSPARCLVSVLVNQPVDAAAAAVSPLVVAGAVTRNPAAALVRPVTSRTLYITGSGATVTIQQSPDGAAETLPAAGVHAALADVPNAAQLPVSLQAELAALRLAANAISTAEDSMTVLAFDVASPIDTPVAHVVLAAVLADVATVAQSACGGRALVLTVPGLAAATSAVQTAPAVNRQRRGTADFPGFFHNGEKIIDFCAEYTCYCNKDINGKPLNPDTSCDINCTLPATPSKCYCSYYPCDCARVGVMPSQRKCKTCEPGFVLTGGYCYVDSIFPATINIVIWLMLAVVLAIAAVWYSLHSITGGKGSVLDRAVGLKDHSD